MYFALHYKSSQEIQYHVSCTIPKSALCLMPIIADKLMMHDRQDAESEIRTYYRFIKQ